VAVAVTEQSRTTLSEELLEEEIDEVFARHEADPHNIELAKQLGALHDQKDDPEGAIAWYEYALALTQEKDPELVRKVSDLKVRQLDRQIRDYETFLAEHPSDDPEFATRAVQLEEAKKERAELLISQARKRLDRNPTDLQLRYQLGEQLTHAGKYRDALPELQRARQNPNARLKAMNLLGRCYRELGMLDLAAKQLDDAAGEMVVMDAVKKEIVYDLALVYEQMGERDKYIEAMKRIYEADYRYRDVARRVEGSYRSTASG
jgi:tetratricopeptide (TPR) repeat protein